MIKTLRKKTTIINKFHISQHSSSTSSSDDEDEDEDELDDELDDEEKLLLLLLSFELKSASLELDWKDEDEDEDSWLLDDILNSLLLELAPPELKSSSLLDDDAL